MKKGFLRIVLALCLMAALGITVCAAPKWPGAVWPSKTTSSNTSSTASTASKITSSAATASNSSKATQKPTSSNSKTTTSKTTATTPILDNGCQHVWKDYGDGQNGQYCSLCKLDYCEVNGHTEESPASCSHGAICSVCKKEYGEKSEHIASTPKSCSDATVCTICGEVLKNAGKHDWIPATCQAPKTCRVCGTSEGSTILHRWGTGVITEEAADEKPGSIRFVCETCGEVKTQALYAGENVGKTSPLFWIILAALLILAGLFAYVYFFVIRKKLGKAPIFKKNNKHNNHSRN